MILITLIGAPQAHVGRRFHFIGPLTECRECRLKGICFNLEPGRLYEITGVRDAEHDCPVHEDKVKVVEVEKRPTEAAVQHKKAIDGSMITFEAMRCDSRGCVNYTYCHPVGLEDGMKLSIGEIAGELECARGERLHLVRLT